MGLLVALLLAQSVTPVQIRAGQDIARPVGATKLADGGYVLNVYVAGQAAGAGGLTDAELRASPVPVSFAVSSNTATGTLAASGQSVTLTTAGQSNGSGILITGTWTGTITFEASPDGSAWGTYETFNPITTVETTQTSTTTNGFFQPLNLGGIAQIRARASAAMTGTANVLIVGTASRTDMVTMALKETGTTAPSYGMMVEGSDGTNARFLKTMTDGTAPVYVAFDGGWMSVANPTPAYINALLDGGWSTSTIVGVGGNAVGPTLPVGFDGGWVSVQGGNINSWVVFDGGWVSVMGGTVNTYTTFDAGWVSVANQYTSFDGGWVTVAPRTVASANNTGTCTTVGVASVTVLASNANRKAYGIKASEANTVNVFCKLGATATTANMPFGKGSAWSQDTGAVYTGVIDCISGSAAQTVCVYEFQ